MKDSFYFVLVSIWVVRTIEPNAVTGVQIYCYDTNDEATAQKLQVIKFSRIVCGRRITRGSGKCVTEGTESLLGFNWSSHSQPIKPFSTRSSTGRVEKGSDVADNTGKEVKNLFIPEVIWKYCNVFRERNLQLRIISDVSYSGASHFFM